MYILKKILSVFLMPMPVCLGLLAVGLGLLFFTKRQRAAKILVVTGYLGLGAVGCDVLAGGFIGTLEDDFPPLFMGDARSASVDAEARKAKYIVVLGAGYIRDRRVPITSQINYTGLGRYVEALRVQQRVPGAKLILSGGTQAGPSFAELGARLLTDIGVPGDRIIVAGTALDTESEARELKATLGAEPFILVTSAAHMPRAHALFRKQGLRPIAAPADYLGTSPSGFSGFEVMPSAASVRKVDKAIHEYVGLLWSRLAGRI